MVAGSNLSAFLRTYLSFLLLGVVVASGPSASANPPFSCINYVHNKQGTDAAQQGNHQGIKSSIAVFAPSNDCERVSSIAVILDGPGLSIGIVEIGWVNGWLPADDNAYSGSGACNDSHFDHPRVFITWNPVGGSYHCRFFDPVDTGFSTFSVFDSNGDGTWKFGFGGSIIDSHAANGDRGDAVTNGERHNNSDTAKAHFKDLQKQVSGLGSNWYDFSTSQHYPVASIWEDPDFHWLKDSETETEVLPN
jgi:hypothetical protein